MKTLVKNFLRAKGYHIFKEGFLPKGVYLDSDLRKLIHLHKVRSVMDVGACEGKMTGQFLELFPNARLVAVEPSPQSYQLLAERYSNHQRVELRQLGAAQENGSIQFSLFEDKELNTFKPMPGDSASPIGSTVVEVRTIADILATSVLGLADIDFLKIDVEGLECECLADCAPLLRANKVGMIFIEAGFCSDDERHTAFSRIHDHRTPSIPGLPVRGLRKG